MRASLRLSCLLRFAWLVLGVMLALLPSPREVFGQSEAGESNEKTTESSTETWFGWVDAPEQQLRTLVQFQLDAEGKPISGTLTSLDQSPDGLALTDIQRSADGTWGFKLKNPNNSNLNAEYAGKQDVSGHVTGTLMQAQTPLKLDLQKLDAIPEETRRTLGADSVWEGTLNAVFRKLDLRIRVYTSPPYATEDNPRVLFDSLTQRVGTPATVQFNEKRTATFEIKSMPPCKIVARLNEAGDQLDGQFLQGSVPLPLTLQLVRDEPQAVEAEKEEPKDTEEPDPKTKPAPMPDKMDEVEAPASRIVRETEFFTEQTFSILCYANKHKGKANDVASKGIRLSGIVTIPKNETASAARYPAVIMVTGSGPQDRDETIGQHKPFEAIAHYLATNGVASLRYDDRGVGESTGDFLTATTEDFARDALEVWKHATTLPSIDPNRIGILGHSEGGIVGPMAALWEPKVAFLILLAPPGLPGSEVLATQIDRMSELQGLSKAERMDAIAMQRELQQLAMGYVTDDAALNRDIVKTVKLHWEGLKSAALQQDPSVNTDALQKQLVAQIQGQFQQLRLPWYRYFLSYDPAPNWQLIQCPTLALWGSKDVQVLPELNLVRLQASVARNSRANVEFDVLPDLNHLFQKADSGLPDEYNSLSETIAPVALSRIRAWLVDQSILDK